MTDQEHAHGRHDHAGHGDAALGEVLDLDAQVLGALLNEVVDWTARHLLGSLCDRVLDVGAGTGTGTVALLRRLPDAEVVALDLSPELLSRLERRAEELGLADRVRVVAADLDAAWPALGPVDLV